MSEQQGYGGYNSEATRALAATGLTAWWQMTQQLMDQNYQTFGRQMELSRRMATSRSVSDFLTAQSELNQVTVQAFLDCGRKLTDAGQSLSRDAAGRMSEVVHAVAETGAQQAHAAEDQFRAAADATRSAETLKTETRDTNEALARAVGAPPANEPSIPNVVGNQNQQSSRNGTKGGVQQR